jgi:cation-transporting ATPase 13A1
LRTVAAPLSARSVKGDDGLLRFEFQKRVFKLDEATGSWLKPRYPTDQPLAFYANATGYTAEEPFKAAVNRWGLNRFDIPLPTFADLYIEQATAPFFVFQVLCVLLWMLDEYWSYSVFTLVLLLIFESTVVNSRLRNLGTLRQMAEQPARPVLVYPRRALAADRQHAAAARRPHLGVARAQA